jgi:hypothetical protein
MTDDLSSTRGALVHVIVIGLVDVDGTTTPAGTLTAETLGLGGG